ncbi:uncharacterized protein LOC131682429 [Topomyia yanbarensis]|uniref:uncharacterized protein LOC131682429 n=1 Tax=Topomyia yanbarensis TaxID=2498891 RepID=UPI00273C416E|nr:uncharacterized protein LOC131682429 [Topomyia yanbarensis]
MVICTFYLNNNCRFGSKCNNDHIDLSSVIKTEVDVTLKGNQWPLSCFGPFKGRNCVPNFVEDYSFEEIRMMFLEAKIQNNIAGHQMQLAQMINDAKQKMQWLSTTNRDIMNILIEIYNEQEDSAKPLAANQTGGNQFGTQISGTGASTAASIFGGGSPGGFGTANSTFSAPTNTAGNIFGAAPNQTTASIFGGVTSANAIGGNLFVKPVQPAVTTSNVFGIPALGQQQQSNSVFGAPPVFGATSASIFSSVNQPQASSGGALFGGGAIAPSSGNLFTQQTQSAFGQPTQAQNLFASTGQPQQTTVSPFVATPASTTGNLFANSSFGSPVQQTATSQQNVFSSAFAAPGQQTSNLFAQPVQQQQPTQGLFLPAPQATQPISAMTNQPVAPFGTPAQSVFGGTSQQIVPPTVAIQSANLYSRLEDLSKDQLDAFNAERFELGKIPTVPPPRELCG